MFTYIMILFTFIMIVFTFIMILWILKPFESCLADEMQIVANGDG